MVEVVGKVALQPVASINSTSAASVNSCKGGLCIGVDFCDFVTVGSFQFSIAFGGFERRQRGGCALGLQGVFGMGGFEPGFCEGGLLQ
ncbi:hypothetical protein D3C71_1546310 [compost metagenome]